MKKIFIFSVLSMVLFTSCRVTKSITMMAAKNHATLTENQFINLKLSGINHLNLSSEQIIKAKAIWAKEIQELKKIELKNEAIAPIIYSSEIDFRKILTDLQNEIYPLKYKNDNSNFNEKSIDGFLNNKQLEEIKRIYKL